MTQSIAHHKKTRLTATCEPQRTILCAHPNCNEYFEYKINKKYHSPECKRDIEKSIVREGRKAIKRGTIHAALMENSPRLKRVAIFLSDRKPHSTRDIIRECDVCAVNAIVDELREPKNGFEIECKQISKSVWEYTMIGGFSELLRIV